jgi:putative ATP-dependent endonuclease of the OLD family
VSAIELFGPDGFGLSILGLVDEAEAPIPAKALGIEVADLEGHGVFTCCTDLEDEYLQALGLQECLRLLTESSHFSEGQILRMCGVGELALVNHDALLTRVLRNDKVTSATAVAAGLTLEQARAIPAVAALMAEAR